MTDMTWRQMLLFWRAAERRAQRQAALSVVSMLGSHHAG